MVFDIPWLVKCPHCRALLWIDEQEEVAKIDCWSDYKGAKSYCDPELKDYLDVLKKADWDLKKRHYLHRRGWWEGNDRRRESSAQNLSLSPEERENLDAYYRCLDPSKSEDRVIMAEIKRELGEFEAAIALLRKPVHKSYSLIANYIKDLVQKRIARVMKIEV